MTIHPGILMRRIRLAILLLLLAASPLAAQDSTITVSVAGPKPAAIDRVIDAMSKAGLTVIQVSEGGLVVGQGRLKNGSDGATYYAALRGSGPVTITWSATLGTFIKDYADIPPMLITSARRNHGGWEILVALSQAVSGSP